MVRVRGIEGLRIVDASIMPDITSANTMACVLAIAEKGADMILGKPALPEQDLSSRSGTEPERSP